VRRKPSTRETSLNREENKPGECAKRRTDQCAINLPGAHAQAPLSLYIRPFHPKRSPSFELVAERNYHNSSYVLVLKRENLIMGFSTKLLIFLSSINLVRCSSSLSCNADNCLRQLRHQSAEASPFCSTYLGNLQYPPIIAAPTMSLQPPFLLLYCLVFWLTRRNPQH
jgi:hypothetical protein